MGNNRKMKSNILITARTFFLGLKIRINYKGNDEICFKKFKT